MPNPDNRLGLRLAFRSLRTPAFRWWFLSQILSASGTMTQGVAQSWLVLKLTGSGTDLGLVTACMFLPLLIGGPYAGALVDRADRRRLLLVTQSLLIGLASVLAALTATGAIRMWMIFVLAAATGSVSAVDSAARQVYVIDLVGIERVASAVSLNEVVLNASRALGPAVGGALLATVGISACCIVNAASYLMPLAVLLAFPAAHRVTIGLTAGSQPGRPERPGRGERWAGLRYAWRHPAIRACLFMAAASGMLFNLNVSLPLFAARVFHLGGGGFGLLMAAFGIGALPGALLASAGASRPGGRSVSRLAVGTALAILATAAAPDTVTVVAGMAVTGCLSIWFIARANTLIQVETGPSMRGRVNGAWNMALPGCNPLTSPIVGTVAGDVGPREGFGLAGIALLLAVSTGWRAMRAMRTGPEPPAEPAPAAARIVAPADDA